MSDEGSDDHREGDAAELEEMAPRWLSGGRGDVRLADNPTALAYNAFVRRLSSLFLREQKRRQDGASDE
jgi:hypothetical protein